MTVRGRTTFGTTGSWQEARLGIPRRYTPRNRKRIGTGVIARHTENRYFG